MLNIRRDIPDVPPALAIALNAFATLEGGGNGARLRAALAAALAMVAVAALAVGTRPAGSAWVPGIL